MYVIYIRFILHRNPDPLCPIGSQVNIRRILCEHLVNVLKDNTKLTPTAKY